MTPELAVKMSMQAREARCMYAAHNVAIHMCHYCFAAWRVRSRLDCSLRQYSGIAGWAKGKKGDCASRGLHSQRLQERHINEPSCFRIWHLATA